MKIHILLAVIAISFAQGAFAQDIDCAEEVFLARRRHDSCVHFFVCLIGYRIDFTCDAEHIFDESRFECRFGNQVTCAFLPIPIPDGECDNDFLRQAPHPDRDQCNRFLVCMNRNLVFFTCPYGQIYSRTTERCVNGNPETCVEGDMVPYKQLMTSLFKNAKRQN